MAVATSGNACERSSQLRENTHTLPFFSRWICAKNLNLPQRPFMHLHRGSPAQEGLHS